LDSFFEEEDAFFLLLLLLASLFFSLVESLADEEEAAVIAFDLELDAVVVLVSDFFLLGFDCSLESLLSDLCLLLLVSLTLLFLDEEVVVVLR
jgi:hypothetical protein